MGAKRERPLSRKRPSSSPRQFGDFNEWNRDSHKCTKDDFGVWSLTLPKLEDGSLPIAHDSRYKCCITKQNGEKVDRIPAWAKYSRQNSQTFLYEAVFWNPASPYVWQHERPPKSESLRIYEAHVGMVS